MMMWLDVVGWDSTLEDIHEMCGWMDLQDADDEHIVSSHECTECDIGHSSVWEVNSKSPAHPPQPTNRTCIDVVHLVHDP